MLLFEPAVVCCHAVWLLVRPSASGAHDCRFVAGPAVFSRQVRWWAAGGGGGCAKGVLRPRKTTAKQMGTRCNRNECFWSIVMRVTTANNCWNHWNRSAGLLWLHFETNKAEWDYKGMSNAFPQRNRYEKSGFSVKCDDLLYKNVY